MYKCRICLIFEIKAVNFIEKINMGEIIMSNKISRRSFFKKSAVAGASSVLGSKVFFNFIGDRAGIAYSMDKIDISVVKGTDYFQNTLKAVEQLGGMKKFVKKNSKVAVLANPQRNNPGAFTKPEVLKAAIRMCKEAGAKEINCISQLGESNWESTGLMKIVKEEEVNYILIDRTDISKFKAIPIDKCLALKEAQIMKVLYDNDVFINIPITKDHAGNKFTGTLKNHMGLNSGPSNRSFHPNWDFSDKGHVEHLDKCIADLNTVVKPTLNIVDATEFITTKGPFGPGEILKPQKVVAGTDRVAVDSYCCTLWGLKGTDIMHIKHAYNYKLGEINLDKVNVKEIEI